MSDYPVHIEVGRKVEFKGIKLVVNNQNRVSGQV